MIEMTGMKINLSTRQWVIVCVSFLLVLYILFQARFLILGPRVTIETPQDGFVTPTQVVMVKGTAYNIAWISLNGRQIFTDENGVWEEKLLVPLGTSIITVNVRDRFGREKEESVRIILNP
jgi:hypothetical protein